MEDINPLNAELNLICHLLALLGAHHILHVSRIRVTNRRLGWAGHIIGMEEERIPKKVLNGNFYTTRLVGGPRTRWVDVVQRDALQLLGIRGWRRRPENRDEWRRLIRETKARKGL